LAQAANPAPGLPHRPTPEGQINFQPKKLENPGKASQAKPKPNPQSAPRSGGQRGQAKQPTPQPANQPQQKKAKPTAAPLGEQTTPPSDVRLNPEKFQFGQVIAREGIKIKTARPTISAVARVSSFGAQMPTAKLTFTAEGTVIDAELVTSTGYENIDAPLLASLYKWQASGPKLETVDDAFTMTIRFTNSDE
jgi:TonB family protein